MTEAQWAVCRGFSIKANTLMGKIKAQETIIGKWVKQIDQDISARKRSFYINRINSAQKKRMKFVKQFEELAIPNFKGLTPGNKKIITKMRVCYDCSSPREFVDVNLEVVRDEDNEHINFPESTPYIHTHSLSMIMEVGVNISGTFKKDEIWYVTLSKVNPNND